MQQIEKSCIGNKFNSYKEYHINRYHLFSQNKMWREMHEILGQYIEVFSTDDIIQGNSWSAVSVPLSSNKKCLFRKLT